MNVRFGSRRGRGGVGNRSVVVGSVWERRMNIDEVSGGVKVFNGGGEEDAEKTDGDGFGRDASDGYEADGKSDLGDGKRKTWNQSDGLRRFGQTSINEKSGSPDRILLGASDGDQSGLCDKAEMDFKKTSGLTYVDTVRRDPVQRRMLNHESGKNADAKTEIRLGDEDAKEEKKDEDIKIKKKKKVESKVIHAAEQKLKTLMDENKSRRSGQAHSLANKYQKSDTKTSMFHSEISTPASLHRKPSTSSSKPSSNTTNRNSVATLEEPIQHEVRRCSSAPHRLQTISESSVAKSSKIQDLFCADITADYECLSLDVVDLLMWRDVSRSAFVFLIGALIIISTSCIRNLNVSLISTVSYLSLGYLAVMFIYRSLIPREADYMSSSGQDTAINEEEAVRILKAVLPYLNNFVSGLKALFSGDPATTMKLAVPLFVLARCGSYISIWNITAAGFFGLFTVPKLGSMYELDSKIHLCEELMPQTGEITSNVELLSCLEFLFNHGAHLGIVHAACGRALLSAIDEHEVMGKLLIDGGGRND